MFPLPQGGPRQSGKSPTCTCLLVGLGRITSSGPSGGKSPLPCRELVISHRPSLRPVSMIHPTGQISRCYPAPSVCYPEVMTAGGAESLPPGTGLVLSQANRQSLPNRSGDSTGSTGPASVLVISSLDRAEGLRTVLLAYSTYPVR